MSKGHIQLISQLEKSHKELGVVLILESRNFAHRGSKTTGASVAARLANQKPGGVESRGKIRRADGTCDRQAAR